MKPFTLLALGMALLIGSTTATAGTQDPGVNKRQHNQAQRIKQGAVSGSLTARETAKLSKQQLRIRKQERRFKADDNLTKRERVSLHRSQNRASRNIFKQKHDRQHR